MSNTQQNKKASTVKSRNVVRCPFYLGNSQIDKDIKKYVLSIPKEMKVTTSIKNVLKSFVQNLSFDWDQSIKINEDELCKNKMMSLYISKIHDQILYDWYKEKMKNSINVTGILKNLVHYQLYKDIGALQIDITEYSHNSRELAVVKSINSMTPVEQIKPKIKQETVNRTKELLSGIG